MSFLDRALKLAEAGFLIFPLIENSKLPLIDGWQRRATRDPEQIRRWWTDPIMGVEQPFNIGISTSSYGDGKALVVVDIDNKGDKRGDDTVLELELEGNDFPATYSQTTPTGGSHLIFSADSPVKQGAGVLGPGLDIRSRGGYIVAAGSTLQSGRIYTAKVAPIAPCPAWIIERCGTAREREAPVAATSPNVDAERARKRAQHYLEKEAPLATQGQRNALGFKAAARLKDFGVTEADAGLLMLEYWHCEPMLDTDELLHVTRSAYRYGTQRPGVAAPEADFGALTEREQPADTNKAHPFTELNKEFAFVVAGGGHHILWETTDNRGNFKLEHLAEPSFHRMLASKTMAVGEKVEPITKLWMNSPERRSYRGICFMPGQTAPSEWYNLWRGFAVEPATQGPPAAVAAVDAWFEHLEQNVCRGNKELAHWLTGYFAHMVQRPWEKPLVALVLRGGKGVGKNALIELGLHGILGAHSMVVTDRRYLVGNFNGHVENLLALTLDEAFWSGDKQAEGILKGLITGGKHVIEHKGKEPYTVDNKCRVIILGNEDWLVPASHDERRFAVFDVGDSRKQDRGFFEGIRTGMEAGGYGLLLGRLLAFDLSGLDISTAPQTQGLMDQKHESLSPFHQWWVECLSEGWMLGSDFGGEWPKEIDKTRLRAAFSRYSKERGLGKYLPGDRAIGRLLKRCAPSTSAKGKRRDGAATLGTYRFGPLAVHRQEWCSFIGHDVEWD